MCETKRWRVNENQDSENHFREIRTMTNRASDHFCVRSCCRISSLEWSIMIPAILIICVFCVAALREEKVVRYHLIQ